MDEKLSDRGSVLRRRRVSAAPIPGRSIRWPSGYSGLVALFLIASGSLSAGQSIVMGQSTVEYVWPDAAWNPANSWRVEMQLSGCVTPGSGQFNQITTIDGIGLEVYYNSNGSIMFTDKFDLPTNGSFIPLTPTGTSSTNVLIRVQRNNSTNTFSVEIWNWDATGYIFGTQSYTGHDPSWTFNGGGIQNIVACNIGFIRELSTVVPLGSGPPTTYPTPSSVLYPSPPFTELKFDGNLNDSSGNGNNASIFSGSCSVCYVNTPNQTAVALPKTYGAPNWSNWLSLRAGSLAQMDGTGSYSLADTSAAVSYLWQEESGPSVVSWTNQTVGQPTMTGLVFGDYVFQLSATDINGSVGTKTLELGAVATDSNGIVIPPDSRITTLLGPIIAFGKSPWTAFDALTLSNYQFIAPNYQVNGGQWMNEVAQSTRSGTVYIANNALNWTGVGSNLSTVFCSGGSTAPGYQYLIPLTNLLGPGVAPDVYGRPIASCASQTSATSDAGYYFQNPTINSPGVSWGTFLICSTCGPWENTNQSTYNVNFYDDALSMYELYWRSGWNPARVSAAWMADNWYRSGQGCSVARDCSFASAWLHNLFDSGPLAPTYSMVPTIEQNTAVWSGGGNLGTVIQDPREDTYAELGVVWEALFDPNSGTQSAALAQLVTDYNNLWLPQQQPAGNYINDEFEGDSSRVFTVTQGSATATLFSGSSLPANYCGTVVTTSGTITIASDRITITLSGGSFGATSTSDMIMLAGTLNSNPWSMASQISSVSGNTLVLTDPWRGDLSGLSPTSWEVLSAPPPQNVYYEMYFSPTDSSGNLLPNVNYPNVDTDSWYWCSNDSTHLFLSTVYTRSTTGTANSIYRRPSWQNLTGRGTQPFQMGITTWMLEKASQATATYNPTVSAGYKVLANNLATWIYNYGVSSSTGGFFYGANDTFSNCQNLAILPAWDCAQAANGTGVNSNSSNERAYLPEGMNAFSYAFLNTANSTYKTQGDTLFNNQWCVPGYTAPAGFTCDGNYVQSAFTGYQNPKTYGQIWGMGQGAGWPAARLGGGAPSSTRAVQIGVAFNGADHIVVTVTAPNGVVSNTTCAAPSSCSVSVDDSMGTGSSMASLTFYNSSGGVINQSRAPFAIN